MINILQFLNLKTIGVALVLATIVGWGLYTKHLSNRLEKTISINKDKDLVIESKNKELKMRDVQIMALEADFIEYEYNLEEKEERDNNITESLKTSEYTFKNIFEEVLK